jgi:hypothetical protein
MVTSRRRQRRSSSWMSRYRHRMDFTVFYIPAGDAVFSGDSTYQVGESNGVLTVNDTEIGRTLVFGAGGWQRVEHAVDDHDIRDSMG